MSLRWWGQAALTLGAVVGSICIGLTLIAMLFDVRTLVFRSGSMEPAIQTGSVAFARPTDASDLEVGDVVSVTASNGVRVTHRIQSLEVAGDQARLTLKGDANGRSDAETYVVESAERVFADVPYVGYAIGFASGPLGLFMGGIVVAGLVWLIVRPARGPSAGKRRAVAAGAVVTIAAAGAVVPSPTSTLAYFSDVGTIASSAVASHTLVSHAQPVCTNVDGILVIGNIARITWTHVDARYEYEWQLRQLNGTVASSGVVGGGQAAGSTVTLDVSTGLLGLNGNYNVAVRARLRGSPTWVAATETVTPVRRASIIVIGVSIRCGHV